MFKIRDWLYISGYAEASNKTILKKNEIKAMLQLFEAIKLAQVDTCFVPIQDGVAITQEKLKEGVAFGITQHKKNKRLLVTCGMGISRSVTFATAILKEVEGISLEAAYRDIRSRHPEALPDHIHWDSLREYYGEGSEFWEIWQSLIMDDEDDF